VTSRARSKIQILPCRPSARRWRKRVTSSSRPAAPTDRSTRPRGRGAWDRRATQDETEQGPAHIRAPVFRPLSKIERQNRKAEQNLARHVKTWKESLRLVLCPAGTTKSWNLCFGPP
jgi:hypothetical protein